MKNNSKITYPRPPQEVQPPHIKKQYQSDALDELMQEIGELRIPYPKKLENDTTLYIRPVRINSWTRETASFASTRHSVFQHTGSQIIQQNAGKSIEKDSANEDALEETSFDC